MGQAIGQRGLLSEYVGQFQTLIGDKRTGVTIGEILKGIINAGSLVCQRIVAQSTDLSAAQDGAQRVIRLATGESTQRSQLDADHLTAKLREHGLRQLSGSERDELGSSWTVRTYASGTPRKCRI
jgi:tRNA(Met) C34 N-acetyltransferase TmcA